MDDTSQQSGRALTADSMHLYRHPEVQTGRPYAFDVDEDGVLWEGQHDGLLKHDSRTGEGTRVRLEALRNHIISTAICFEGRVVVTHMTADHVTSFDTRAGRTTTHRLDNPEANIWYGQKAAGKLLLFDRGSAGGILVFDSLSTKPRLIPKDDPDEDLIGRPLADGRVLVTAINAKRRSLKVLLFDAKTERFDDRRHFDNVEYGLTGSVEHRGVVYFGDSAAGRILPYELASGRFREPIPTPDVGKTYGFIGGSFQLGTTGYFCLSTYRFRSRMNPETGELILPDGWDVGTDGNFPRFLDRFLMFDAASGKFDYLIGPQQPDGELLLCYSQAAGSKVFITGYVIPHGRDRKPSQLPGDWVVWQNFAGEEKPFDPAAVLGRDRAEHIRASSRSAPLSRGLYVVEPTHSPAIENMEGPSFEYPPGLEQRLRRRLAISDSNRYLRELAPLLAAGAKTDKERVAAVGRFIHQRLYYNPISVPYLEPAAVIESGDARCGHALEIGNALFAELGIEHRGVGIRNHCVNEVRYDGSWHVQDSLIFGGNQPERDGRVVSVDEIKADPYFADGFPVECFAYDTAQLRSADDFYILGYCFGEWGSMPYYSGFYGADWEYPPTMPVTLPAQRLDDDTVRLRWAGSIKRNGGAVEYRVEVFDDRAMTNKVHSATVPTNHLDFRVPRRNVMYFHTVAAVDDHRERNPKTWYPTRRSNFVHVPRTQYGWYGVV